MLRLYIKAKAVAEAAARKPKGLARLFGRQSNLPEFGVDKKGSPYFSPYLGARWTAFDEAGRPYVMLWSGAEARRIGKDLTARGLFDEVTEMVEVPLALVPEEARENGGTILSKSFRIVKSVWLEGGIILEPAPNAEFVSAGNPMAKMVARAFSLTMLSEVLQQYGLVSRLHKPFGAE
jgi:hypothetical protein